ncbi:MAG: sugar ABC transporter permease [Armatimonadetes bacterium]|nr:sugar ABC transporter permease [Armatimonadota bacterium]
MRRKKQRWFVISFLSPALLIYAVLFVWPVIQAFYVSLFEWSGLSDVRKFVGLANFQHLIGDKVVWQALTHNMVFLLLGGVVMMVLALVIAHCLQGESGAAKTLRGIYLLPHIVSLVIVAVLWKFIYNPSMGMATTHRLATVLHRDLALALVGETHERDSPFHRGDERFYAGFPDDQRWPLAADGGHAHLSL